MYFLAVFATGFGLGVIRVLLIVPRIGTFAAVLCEAPFMIAAMAFAARWVGHTFHLERRSHRVVTGLVALLFLLAAELSGAVWLRGLSIGSYVASMVTPEGLLTLSLFALFAAVPGLQRSPGDLADS